MQIHKRMYEAVKFFKNKDKSFITWVGPMLQPMNVAEQEYIFKEGEEITESKDYYELILQYISQLKGQQPMFYHVLKINLTV